MPPVVEPVSPRFTRADGHFLLACALVLAFTAQRLSGYMTLYLYQRLAYDHLVLIAHFFGGAGLIAACTMGATGAPMGLRRVPVIRAVAGGGWLAGSFLVGMLWWVCVPWLRPETPVAQALTAVLFGVVVWKYFRLAEQWVAAQANPRAWRLGLVAGLWQAYSLDWELHLNFAKDGVTALRRSPQWSQIAVDLLATAAGLAWSLAVARRAEGQNGLSPARS